VIDEYGFTNKSCRSCGNNLSIEEVIALSIPLDANGNPQCKVEDLNFEEMALICLNCYAE
jgi:ribosomal protein L40E